MYQDYYSLQRVFKESVELRANHTDEDLEIANHESKEGDTQKFNLAEAIQQTRLMTKYIKKMKELDRKVDFIDRLVSQLTPAQGEEYVTQINLESHLNLMYSKLSRKIDNFMQEQHQKIKEEFENKVDKTYFDEKITLRYSREEGRREIQQLKSTIIEQKTSSDLELQSFISCFKKDLDSKADIDEVLRIDNDKVDKSQNEGLMQKVDRMEAMLGLNEFEDDSQLGSFSEDLGELDENQKEDTNGLGDGDRTNEDATSHIASRIDYDDDPSNNKSGNDSDVDLDRSNTEVIQIDQSSQPKVPMLSQGLANSFSKISEKSAEDRDGNSPTSAKSVKSKFNFGKDYKDSIKELSMAKETLQTINEGLKEEHSLVKDEDQVTTPQHRLSSGYDEDSDELKMEVQKPEIEVQVKMPGQSPRSERNDDLQSQGSFNFEYGSLPKNQVKRGVSRETMSIQGSSTGAKKTRTTRSLRSKFMKTNKNYLTIPQTMELIESLPIIKEQIAKLEKEYGQMIKVNVNVTEKIEKIQEWCNEKDKNYELIESDFKQYKLWIEKYKSYDRELKHKFLSKPKQQLQKTKEEMEASLENTKSSVQKTKEQFMKRVKQAETQLEQVKSEFTYFRDNFKDKFQIISANTLNITQHKNQSLTQIDKIRKDWENYQKSNEETMYKFWKDLEKFKLPVSMELQNLKKENEALLRELQRYEGLYRSLVGDYFELIDDRKKDISEKKNLQESAQRANSMKNSPRNTLQGKLIGSNFFITSGRGSINSSIAGMSPNGRVGTAAGSYIEGAENGSTRGPPRSQTRGQQSRYSNNVGSVSAQGHYQNQTISFSKQNYHNDDDLNALDTKKNQLLKRVAANSAYSHKRSPMNVPTPIKTPSSRGGFNQTLTKRRDVRSSFDKDSSIMTPVGASARDTIKFLSQSKQSEENTQRTILNRQFETTIGIEDSMLEEVPSTPTLNQYIQSKTLKVPKPKEGQAIMENDMSREESAIEFSLHQQPQRNQKLDVPKGQGNTGGGATTYRTNGGNSTIDTADRGLGVPGGGVAGRGGGLKLKKFQNIEK